MKLAIVTACPNGMVTSVLCARLLDAAAQRQGWSTSVEVVDVQRPERQLSQATLDDAEWVLLVSSTPVDMQRFVGKRVFQSTPAQALADVDAVLRRGAQEAQVYVATEQAAKQAPRIVAITACPTGVAHTFMAAEALQQTAKRLGYDLQVETQGSVGARTPLSPQAIAEADVVLLAADIEVATERFAGKKIYRCGTGIALKQSEATLNKALAEGAVESAASGAVAKKEKTGVYKHLLTGVSFMLPMVVAGGLLIALSFVFGIHAFEQEGTLAAALKTVGDRAFMLMVPLLAGYIAYSIADRPGIAPGMIGGLLAGTLGAGFIGGIFAGFLAGYCVKLITRAVKLPQSLEALKPILIIPLLASLFTGLAMIYLVGPPGGAPAHRPHRLPQHHGHHQCGATGHPVGRHDVCRPRRADQQGRVCVFCRFTGGVQWCADGGDHGRGYGAADWHGHRHVPGAPQVRPDRTRGRQGGDDSRHVLYL